MKFTFKHLQKVKKWVGYTVLGVNKNHSHSPKKS